MSNSFVTFEILRVQKESNEAFLIFNKKKIIVWSSKKVNYNIMNRENANFFNQLLLINKLIVNAFYVFITVIEEYSLLMTYEIFILINWNANNNSLFNN